MLKTTKQQRMQFRQGDVLIVAASHLPQGATVRARENGLVILAYGEVTGHHHSFSAPGVALLDVPNGTVYLTIEELTAPLVHQEHDAIAVPQGTYQVVRQREYTPEAILNVAD